MLLKSKLLAVVSFFVLSVAAQQPALLIQRVFTNPSGSDSPFEFVELVATRSIDFSTEKFTVVFADGSVATVVEGWHTGGMGTYALQISSGTVTAGDLIYVGGSSLSINGSGCKILRQINTGTTGGDSFGSSNSAGVLGNGGSNADGLAVFDLAAASITAAAVPIDALFFGTAPGSAAGKFKVPSNDLYSGGIFGDAGNTFLAPDPGSGEYIYVSAGIFFTNNFTWGTARSWSLNTTKPNCGNAPLISFQTGSSLGLSVNHVLTTPFINPNYVSGVISDPTDPAATSGIILDVTEGGAGIPASDYTLTASSSNTGVVPNAGVSITKANGLATVKILPSGVGFSNITLQLSKNGANRSLVINYAASGAAVNPANTFWHTGVADASAAIAQNGQYALIADDESNRIYVYDRSHSGLPVFTSADLGSQLGLADVTKEVDIEAAAKSISVANRVYWLGSMSNGSDNTERPNRNRLFATAVSGTGPATTVSYTGRYDNLRSRIISWGDANGYNFSASAASGKDAKAIDGFNAEGMCFGPDNTTLYIAFRAPLVPVANRTKAIISPIVNFESWFNNGAPSGNPTFGSPIELDLGGRGIRDIIRLQNGVYVIIAGNYAGMPLTGAVYRWTGLAGNAPQLINSFDLTGLNVEAVMETDVPNQLQLVTDGGTTILYNNGVEAKDEGQPNWTKYRSDIRTGVAGALSVVYVFNGNGNWDIPANWVNQTIPPTILPSGAEIIIDPAGTGECVLNVPQQLSSGSRLTVNPSKKFRINGNLQIN